MLDLSLSKQNFGRPFENVDQTKSTFFFKRMIRYLHYSVEIPALKVHMEQRNIGDGYKNH